MTGRGTFKMWPLLTGGLPIQGHLTGNCIHWSWSQWSFGTGGHLDRFYCITNNPTWMGSLSALVPVVVRLIHSPPPLGAASAARVYRVLAAVVSSLRGRKR